MYWFRTLEVARPHLSREDGCSCMWLETTSIERLVRKHGVNK